MALLDMAVGVRLLAAVCLAAGAAMGIVKMLNLAWGLLRPAGPSPLGKRGGHPLKVIRSLRQSRGIWLLLLFLAAFLAGYGRAGAVKGRFEREIIQAEAMAGQEAWLFGEVRQINEGAKGITLRLGGARAFWEEEGEGRWGDFGQVSVFLETELLREEKLGIGSAVQVRGELAPVEGARNPGAFDFGLYARSQGYCCQMYGEEWQAVSGEIKPYFEGIRRFRGWCAGILERVCDKKDLGVFQAVVLGDKSAMEPRVRDMYQRHGISHLLAVSGQHLAIVGGGMYLVFRKIGLRPGAAGALGAVFVVSYGILTGSSGSAMRAVVMILCLWLAGALGRSYDSLSALGAAAMILLWQSPYLMFQSGFQLSFGAVWAIAGLGGPLGEALGAKSGWQRTLAVSLAVQLVLTPLAAWHFFRYPLYSLALNLLVMPLAAGLMYSGIGAILLGAMGTVPGRLAAGSGHWILAFYEGLCGIFERLPGYSILTGRPGALSLAFYGAAALAAVYGLWRLGRGKKGKRGGFWRRFSGMVLVYGGCLFLLRPEAVRGLNITCLDVGQGDGIVIWWNGGAVLVDGGSSSEKELGEDCLEPFLESRRISRLDCALVSHGDTDHISGLLYLLEENQEMELGLLALPRLGRGGEPYERLAELARERGAQVAYLSQGDVIDLGQVRMECLYAGDPRAQKEEDPNRHSLAVDLGYGAFHMLFTGDMDEDCERGFLEEMEKQGREEELRLTQVLKVAHHGSKTATSQEFLEAVRPQAAVVSYGRGNRYGHPAPEVMQRLKEAGVQVWETGKRGAVTVEVWDESGEGVIWGMTEDDGSAR